MNADILCSSRELFGSDRSALRLAAALKTNGVDPTLIVPANRPEMGLADAAEARGICVREEPIAIATARGIEKPSAFRRRGAGPAPDLTILNSTAVLSSAHRGSQKIVVVREWLEPKSPRHRLLVRRHRMGGPAIVGISSGVLRQWSRCTRGPEKRWLVHNWLDKATLQSAASGDHGTTTREGVLFIGRFNRWKGQEVLADAYETAFSSSNDRPKLTFVGAQAGTAFAGPAETLTERGMRAGWTVLPFTPDPADHFRSAALVVVPSLRPEPFGMVILEALAFGCRVLAFEGGGPSDLATKFPNAIELVQRDESSLAGPLAAWWKAGGQAQSDTDRIEVGRILESDFSPEAGAASWRAVLDG
jgi:glycosyltransferase involved in cell wall biosynthesis